MISHGHNAEHWWKKIWMYHPIDQDPQQHYELQKWWVDLIPPLGNKIMEIGPWSGLTLIWLKQNFPEKDIVAVDINPQVCHFLKTRLYYLDLMDKISVYNGDGFDLKGYGDQSKDLIFHDGLAEHFDEADRVKLLKEHLRVAKYVVCAVPLKEALEKGGGYSDERKLTYDEWAEFMFKYFKVKCFDSYNDVYEIHTSKDGSCVAFVLEGVKNE